MKILSEQRIEKFKVRNDAVINVLKDFRLI